MSLFSLLYLSKINNSDISWHFIKSHLIRRNSTASSLFPEVTKELSNDNNHTNLEFDWIKLSEKFNLVFQNILHLCEMNW